MDYSHREYEGMGAVIVASVDASLVLKPAEHVLDFVALVAAGLVLVDLGHAIGPSAGRA